MNPAAERISILTLLLDGKVHSAKELRQISLEYRSRISEWRKKGYKIPWLGKNRLTGRSEYRLVGLPGAEVLIYEVGSE